MFWISLGQMAVMASFILIGLILVKVKVLDQGSSKILSKLENSIFIPALAMGTFITNFTREKVGIAWKLLLFSFAVLLVVIPIAILCARLATGSDYIRKIYTYGLSFANFGFMGFPVVAALFPQYNMYYMIFTLPLWTLIYVWGVPSLLMSDGNEKKGIASKLKALVNPMFIALIIGAIIGICGIKIPDFALNVINTCSECMSPIAMIITGITFASISLKKVLSDLSIYFVTLVRLILIPLLFGGIYILCVKLFSLDIPEYYFACMICSLIMPLGLNTVVIPAAYGRDTSVAAGMALVSHVLSLITVPLMLMLFGF